jgi:hypothetical protein
MHHSEYEIRFLAEMRAAELIAEAERLNQLHDARRRRGRRSFRALLIRFRRPAPDPTLLDLRERPPEAAPNPAPASGAADGSKREMHTGLRF